MVNLPDSRPDIEKHGDLRARVPGRHGGTLRPFLPGNKLMTGYRKPHRLTETLRLARQASPAAMKTLIRHLNDPDGRVAITAANLVLERGWGRVREMPEEVQEQVQLDASGLTGEELAALARLVASGRLRPAGATEEGAPPQEIEGEVDPQ
jgi:hypothetical protein